MIRRRRSSLSSRTKLITFAFIAVMLPTTVLSVIQYRSLVELEGKTKVAVQENLRQTLQNLSRKIEKNLKAIAMKSLGPIQREYPVWSLQKSKDYFTAITKKHPEIDQLFVVSWCPTSGKEYALFCDAKGVRSVELSRFKETPEVASALKAYDSARISRAPYEWKDDFLFWQTRLSNGRTWGKSQYRTYIFQPMFCSESGECQGFSGLSLTDAFIQDEFLPLTVPELLRSSEISMKDSDLVLGIFDRNKNPIYSSIAAGHEFEVRAPFAPVFPMWDLAIGYKDTTIEALAKDNFQKSLMLSLFVLSLLIIGISLMLRATAREMKLAQAKSTFVSNVSHELKTPLALIRLFAETLELGRVKTQEKAHEYYRIINHESRRLTQLINNILDFSKIEAGRKEYEFMSANVAEVVEDVLTSYEYQITSAGFELTTEIEKDLPPALIDRDALSQAVLNLLNNAIKYSEDEKHISVAVGKRDNSIAIEVADKGIGIPRSEHEKIFEEFYRVSTGLVHNTKGSGLGLALVKHIIEAHAGKIAVESAPGKGSKFTILLPANGVEVEPAGEAFAKGAGGYTVAENPGS